MIKLTVRYPDERELDRFIELYRPYIVHIHPKLSKPGKISPGTEKLRRDIYLDLWKST